MKPSFEPEPSGRENEPRDVVYVVASMITGGTQTHLLQVLRLLDRKRYRAHLYCLRDTGDLLSAARALGVQVSTFGMSGTLRALRDLTGLMRMVVRLRRVRPAVVHGYLLRGNFFGALAARVAGVHAIVTSKRGLHKPRGAAERFAVTVSNRLSDLITGNSPAVLDFTRNVERKVSRPMRMIPSGIDTERFSPVVADSLRDELEVRGCPVVGTAITWRPKKGFRMLFEVFARVLSENPRARLLIAGERDWVGEPERLARELGILDAVVLLGKRDDMPRVLAALDVFVLPSESEGMSNALLEAMAMARPVVATAVGGNPHVVTDGVTGFLVEYGDSAGMARKISVLLAQPEVRDRIGGAARERIVAGFSAASMVRQIEAMYDALLADGGLKEPSGTEVDR